MGWERRWVEGLKKNNVVRNLKHAKHLEKKEYDRT